MQLLYFKGHPPNFGDELNRFIFESLFVDSVFRCVEPTTYFMGVGSILHPAYLQRFAGETADITTYGGTPSRMNKAVVFGAGVREHKLNFDPTTLDLRFVRGPISAAQTGAKSIADAAYLLPLLKEYSEIIALPKKYKVSLVPYFHHAFALDYDRISDETGVHVIQPYKDVCDILREVQQSELVVAGAMHGCIAADIFRIPWIRLRLMIHEANPVVQTVKWRDFADSMELDELATMRMTTENSPDIKNNTPLEHELIKALKDVSGNAVSMSSDHIFDSRVEQLAEQVRSFSRKYGIAVNSIRTLFNA